MTDHLHRELDAVASREPISDYPSAAIRAGASARLRRRKTTAAVLGGSVATLAVVATMALATNLTSQPDETTAATATDGATSSATDGALGAGERRTVAVGRLAIDVPADVDVAQAGICGPRNGEVLLWLGPETCAAVDPGVPFFGANFQEGAETSEVVAGVTCSADDDVCTGVYEVDGIGLRVVVQQPEGGARAYLQAEVTDHVRVLDQGEIGIPTNMFLDALTPEEYVDALGELGLQAELGPSPARTDDLGYIVTEPATGTVVPEGTTVRVG